MTNDRRHDDRRPDRLAATTAAQRYQRGFFDDLRAHAAAGGEFALVNADTPHEILRTMGIPYVVNQWWASIVAAKQRAAGYLERLRERGYPDDIEQYNAAPLGGMFAPDPDADPWGGLPQPSLVLAETTGDATRKVFDVWAEEFPGTEFVALESAAAHDVPTHWWELMPWHWEDAVGTDRIDLLVGELTGLIRRLEDRTGRRFSESRFREVMALANEQAEYNRRTRDLIAAARPCPVDVPANVPAVMLPQWHRGTGYARDAARALQDEVADRVSAGAAVCRPERARLMWIGRGLWFDMGFYERFRREYGAVFVWSMYLAIAADGYARYGDDPLRALAARFAAFSDQLYTPPWSTEWYLKEARAHGVDGVVHLVSDDARGGYFTTRALEDAGIPVLELHADNVDPRTTDRATMTRTVAEWLEHRVLPDGPGV
ncbi:2-hydroxyacyl-CoA dehydratase family protein [Saccharomonospora iraqiensis]|uniref:2-hydroxyacyl-CoA dehydratase family protein n=1 Tax=Saccharomonospora iraqiensis TaxID=52698 RepID=UPI00041261EE|nr:2-hydroxyacyl-CoA dehydratase family protein [Saccharomonospora iraqiensis]